MFSSKEKKLEREIRKVLIENGKFSDDLYKEDLAPEIEAWIDQAKKDGDEFTWALTEYRKQFAMVLFTKKGELFINEMAREKLKELLKSQYAANIEYLM